MKYVYNLILQAKLLDNQNHFTKYEMFREPHLNTTAKGVLAICFYKNFIYRKHINKSTKYVYLNLIPTIKRIYFTSVDNSLKFDE